MAIEPRPSDAEPFDAESIIDEYEEHGNVTDEPIAGLLTAIIIMAGVFASWTIKF